MWRVTSLKGKKKWLHIKPLSDPPTLIIIHQTLTVTTRSDIRWQDFQPDILIIRSWRLHWIIIWMPNSLHWVLLIDHFLAGGFKDFLFSPLKLGKWSNLTHIFQMGWFNHQLVFTDWKLQWLWNDFACLWDTNPLHAESESKPWWITFSQEGTSTFTSDMTFLRHSMGIFQNDVQPTSPAELVRTGPFSEDNTWIRRHFSFF